MPAPIVVSVKAPIALSPDALWAFLYDTDRMNRAVDLPPVRFVPDLSRQGHYRAETHVFGMLLTYEEVPWDWVAPRYYHMKRRFGGGPIAEVDGGIRIEPTSTGSELEVWGTVIPRGWLGKLAGRKLASKANTEIFAYARALEAHAANPAKPAPGRPPAANVDFDVLDARLKATDAAGPAAKLRSYLLEASDLEVLRLRPFALADRWGEDRTTTLRYFLHAARAGVLDLSWSVLCPSCRVTAAKTRKLSEMKSKAHCDTCRIEFGADLAASVEARFNVNPAVRRARGETFCIGGPANMPDILAQLRLEPGEKRRESIRLQKGAVRIRCYQSPGIREIQVGSGAKALSVVCAADGLRASAAELAEGELALEVENPLPTEALVVVERETWKDQAATAAFVASMQEFRDLFPAEAVAPGEELSIASLAVLFTDLKGSTDLYRRAGDSRAFTFVQNHFRYLTEAVAARRGGVVKTMGDAIMATFGSALDAVQAAVAMQRGWTDFQAGKPDAEGVLLRVGVHHGSSIAINNAGRLDYFGTTVNTAARVQGQAEGGEVMLSAGLAEDPGVRKYLIAEGLRSEESRAWLKGLDGEHRLIRLRFGP